MFLLGILPSIVFFFLMTRSNKVKRESTQVLRKLLLFGAVTVLSAMTIGFGGDEILGSLDPKSMLYIFIDNFIVTALVEELGKYIVLKKFSWNHSGFDYTVGAVVYAVTVSMGFATLENLLYMIDADIITGIVRAVLSVPGHAIDAVFMGVFYAKAKAADVNGNKKLSKAYLRKALLVPVLLHGFYDFSLSCIECCNSIISLLLLLVFLVFAIGEMVVAVKIIKVVFKEDSVLKKDIQLPWYFNKREIAYYSSIR